MLDLAWAFIEKPTKKVLLTQVHRDIMSALESSTGFYLHQVDYSNLCTLWYISGESLLLEFSRWCALQVISLWNHPESVTEYLKTGTSLDIEKIRQEMSYYSTYSTGEIGRASCRERV